MPVYHVQFNRAGKHIMSTTQEAPSPFGAITRTCLPMLDRREGPETTLDRDGGTWEAELLED